MSVPGLLYILQHMMSFDFCLSARGCRIRAAPQCRRSLISSTRAAKCAEKANGHVFEYN